MASSIALPRPHAGDSVREIAALVPGIGLLVALGYGGKFLERAINTFAKTHHLTIPNIEYVLWAIVIGLVVSNTVGVHSVFRPGVATYEFWLKTGIVLLGSRFLLGDVAHLGGISLGLVVVEISLAIAFMTWMGRA